MSGTRITDLSNKEVINVCNGMRFGYVCDIEIDCVCGNVIAIIVPGPCRWKFWQRQDYIIPWNAITHIGDDIILVNYELKICPRSEKKSWFS